METIGEKVSYLKGLCEGLNISDEKEGKVLKGIIDVLADISAAIDDVEDEVFELNELCDELDQDLGMLEEEIYDDDCGCCDCDCDCDCDCEDDEEFYEIECDKCGELIYLEESEIFEDGVICPECGEKIDVDFDDVEE